MKQRLIQKFITPDIRFATLLSISYVAIWILNFFFQPDFQDYQAASARLINPDGFWIVLLIFAITILNMFLISQFNNKLNIIRTKTFLPLFIYALLICTWKESHFLILSHIGLTFLIISLMLFMGMYRNNKAVEPAFLGSLILSIAGFINPTYLFLIFLSWIGFIIIKCASLRIYLASLMGALIPWIFYISYSLMTNSEMLVFNHFILDFEQHSIFVGRHLYEQIYIASILLLLLIGVGGMYSKMYNDSIQARKYLNFILLLLIFVVILVVLFSKHALSFLPMIAFGYAMLLAHQFSLNRSKFYETLFYIFTFINLAYLVLNFIYTDK
jgi:hypothetical protein